MPTDTGDVLLAVAEWDAMHAARCALSFDLFFGRDSDVTRFHDMSNTRGMVLLLTIVPLLQSCHRRSPPPGALIVSVYRDRNSDFRRKPGSGANDGTARSLSRYHRRATV
jgi:hypothetical protein